MRTDVMAFPWRCRRPAMGALTMKTVLLHAGAAYRSEPCAIARSVRFSAIIALKRAGRRAIAAARMPMNVKDADKAHVGAWDGDETAQNVAERPR